MEDNILPRHTLRYSYPLEVGIFYQQPYKDQSVYNKIDQGVWFTTIVNRLGEKAYLNQDTMVQSLPSIDHVLK